MHSVRISASHRAEFRDREYETKPSENAIQYVLQYYAVFLRD